MEPFSINLQDNGDSTIVHLRGDASCVQADLLREGLEPVLDREPSRVVLNLAHLDFINSLGLGVVVAFYKKLRAKNASLSLAGPTPNIDEVLRTTRLTDLIPTFPDVDAALASG